MHNSPVLVQCTESGEKKEEDLQSSSSLTLIANNISRFLTDKPSGMTQLRVIAVAHDTKAVVTLKNVIVANAKAEVEPKVHRLIRCVSPQRTMKAPNCATIHL
jgi:hypothetical protein